MIDLTKIGRVTSEYGSRTNPVTGRAENHAGIDIVLNSDYIPAVESGTVIENSFNSGRGYYVRVKDAGGNVALYQHLATRSKYNKGDKVTEGDTVGIQGASGMVTGKHLHFEIKNSAGALFDPRTYMKGGTSATDLKFDDVDKETEEQKNAGGLAWWGDIVKVVIMALLVLAGAGLLVTGVYGEIKKG